MTGLLSHGMQATSRHPNISAYVASSAPIAASCSSPTAEAEPARQLRNSGGGVYASATAQRERRSDFESLWFSGTGLARTARPRAEDQNLSRAPTVMLVAFHFASRTESRVPPFPPSTPGVLRMYR